MIDDAKVQADRMRECVKGCPFPNVYTEMNAGADTIERLMAEKAERDAVRLHYEARIGELKAELAALKWHAEKMAETIDLWAGIDECKCSALDAYRADYPENGK